MEGAIKQLINQRKQILEVIAIKQEEVRKLTETIQHLHALEPTIEIPEEIKNENTKEVIKPKSITKEAIEPKNITKNGSAQSELDTINKKAQSSNSEKWTVIFDGPFSGIYKDWNIAAQYIKGRSHTSYNTKEEAEKAFQHRFKEVLAKSPKKAEMRLAVSIPKIQSIQTKAQIEKAVHSDESTYNKHLQVLLNYTDEDRSKGYYPVNKGGPKAVATDVASAIDVYQLFQEGLLAMVYTSTTTIFRHFPTKFRDAIDIYMKSKGHGREVFLRIHNTTPYFAEGEIIAKPKSLCQIGISNGGYPPMEPAGTIQIKDTHKEESFFAVLAETRKIKVEEKKKINYASNNIVLISNFDKRLTAEAIMVIANFEVDFYNLGGIFQKIPEEDKKKICGFIKVFEDHKCEECYQEKEEAIIEDITEESM